MVTTTRQIVGANGQTLSIVVIPSAVGTPGDAQLVGLTDGTNSQAYTAAGAAKVDGSGVIQPISAASLPLPSGAAQDSTLINGTAKALVSPRAATASATEVSVSTSTSTVCAASATAQYRNLTNRGAVTAWLSPNTPVTTGVGGNSIQLQAGESRDINYTGAVYAATASGTTTIDVWTEVQ